MPYKFEYENMKIKEEDKRNRKLTDKQREEIRELYATGKYSQRELAKKYNVTKNVIVYAIYPEKYKKARERYKEIQKTGRYYNRETQRRYSQNYRKYKHDLYLKGKLIGGKDE